ncbi:MAG: LPS export ABC transporter periplasmic protein LptC [Bacteroidales bacterium]|nr:LPS export ABC transporter periplasmic protein LptC [Bacteroidales bacterium]
MRRLLPLAVVTFLLLAFAGSCKKEKKVDRAAGLDPERMATMSSHNVETLISDSGIVQFKMLTPIWLVYEEVDTPCWKFPQGLYLERFGPTHKVIASVAADSARYFTRQKLWRLDGHVEIKKIPGDLFQTSQLFWNEKHHRVYSDSFVHIETPTHVLEGFGFESDDNLTDYSLRTPSGIFPIHQDAFGNRTAVAADSTAH